MSLSSDQISISQRNLSLSQDMKPEVLQLKTQQTAPLQERVQECRRESRQKQSSQLFHCHYYTITGHKDTIRPLLFFSSCSKVIGTNVIKKQWRLYGYDQYKARIRLWALIYFILLLSIKSVPAEGVRDWLMMWYGLLTLPAPPASKDRSSAAWPAVPYPIPSPPMRLSHRPMAAHWLTLKSEMLQ